MGARAGAVAGAGAGAGRVVTTQGQSEGVVCAGYWLRTPGRGREEPGKEESRAVLRSHVHSTWNVEHQQAFTDFESLGVTHHYV